MRALNDMELWAEQMSNLKSKIEKKGDIGPIPEGEKPHVVGPVEKIWRIRNRLPKHPQPWRK
jgi:hypothetical protein